jgi:hypothetical protein
VRVLEQDGVKNRFKGSSCTRKGNSRRAVGSASSLRLLQKELKGGELVDSGADGSPKWGKPVGHDMQAKAEYRPLSSI